MRYLFVGERQSPTALAHGWTWTDGHLAAATLHEALRAHGVDPSAQVYVNLYEPGTGPRVRCGWVLAMLRHADLPIVAMGERVQRELRRQGIPFIPLIHPAARGMIRKKERYHAHVGKALEVGQ